MHLPIPRANTPGYDSWWQDDRAQPAKNPPVNAPPPPAPAPATPAQNVTKVDDAKESAPAAVKEMCRSYMMGTCPRGAQCKHIHCDKTMAAVALALKNGAS